MGELSRSTVVANPSFLKNHILTILTLICAMSGFAIGQAIRHAGWSEQVDRYIDIPGQMLLHGYSMLLVPVLFCGIILGVASLRHAGSRRVVILTAMFFMLLMGATSTFSCVLGKHLRLGHHMSRFAGDVDNMTDFDDDSETVINSLVDFFENAIPDNIIMATFIEKETISKVINTSDGNNTHTVIKRHSEYKYQTNFVGLLTFGLIFGSAMAILGNKVQTLYLVLDEINLVIMAILQFMVKLLPIGLFFWMCCQGITTESLGDTFSRMGFYLTVFISVQLGYNLLFLPFLYLVIVRKNPLHFMASMCPAVLLAFGSSSSSACLPLTLKLMEEGQHCHPFVTRFVLPLGSLLNMQGSTLATPLTVFFIAGLQDVHLGLVKTVVLGLSNVLLQMAFPGIPSNGMTTLWFLYFVGVAKPYVIGLVLSVEWFLDRIVTINNVIGNCYVATFVDKLSTSVLVPLHQVQTGTSFLIVEGSLTSGRSSSVCSIESSDLRMQASVY